MSKKIIYLLSLLMALSLVFASCKKNGAGTDPGDDWNAEPPKEEDNTAGIVDGDTGLVDDFTKLPADKVIKKETIFEGDGVNYLRNPVIVVLGTDRSDVAVFAEKRYKSKGADNDVGINGTSAVDIVYRFSGNSGVRFESESIVGPGGKGAAGPNDSHGAPVVFKVGDNKVVVVASAGGGIARTEEAAVAGKPTTTKPASKIEYIVGNLSGTSFTWSDWKEVQFKEAGDLLTTVQAIITPNGKDYYTQMGTHSAKGQVSSDNNTLILPVVMAQQGVTGSGAKELMGVYFVKGTMNGEDVTWSDTQKHIEFKTDNNANFSVFKETRVIDGNSEADVKYVAIPNPGYGISTFGLGSDNSSQPQASAISGHFGSPGYLTLKWYGAETYTPANYKDQAADKSLFLGVKTQNTDVTLYLVAKNTLQSEGSYLVNAVGKSGSIDVLGDGTVVTAAEEGSNGDRNYYTSFTRYSQSYLTSLLK